MDILVPKGNIGIERKHLPQIENKDLPIFLKSLKSNNVEFVPVKRSANNLKPIQNELNKDKILSILDENDDDYILVISKENYICDGHHRWAASLNRNENTKIKCIKINLCIIDLINWLNDLGFTKNKEIHEHKKSY